MIVSKQVFTVSSQLSRKMSKETLKRSKLF